MSHTVIGEIVDNVNVPSGGGVHFLGPPISAGNSLPVTTWYMIDSNFAVGSTLTNLGTFLGANEVPVWQFVLPFTITVNLLSFEVVTPDPGNNVGVAIYDAAGTTKLIDTGAQSAATGIIGVAIPSVILTPGIYWLAYTHDGVAVTVRGLGNVPNFNAFFNDNTTKVGTAANAGVAGVCPATLGAITPQTAIGQILVKLET